MWSRSYCGMAWVSLRGKVCNVGVGSCQLCSWSVYGVACLIQEICTYNLHSVSLSPPSLSISVCLSSPFFSYSLRTPHPVSYTSPCLAGDTCCDPLSLGRIMKLIEQEIPGIYIHSIQIGNNFEEDFLSGFFKNSNDQVSTAQHTALSCYIYSTCRLQNAQFYEVFCASKTTKELVQNCYIMIRVR